MPTTATTSSESSDDDDETTTDDVDVDESCAADAVVASELSVNCW